MALRSLCNFAGNSLLRNVVHLDKSECFNEERDPDLKQRLMFLSNKARIPLEI